MGLSIGDGWRHILLYPDSNLGCNCLGGILSIGTVCQVFRVSKADNIITFYLLASSYRGIGNGSAVVIIPFAITPDLY
jgi:hypothetical protein